MRKPPACLPAKLSSFLAHVIDDQEFFLLEEVRQASILRLRTKDGTNRLSRACILSTIAALDKLAENSRPLIITGNERFFSVGADLEEIAQLAPTAALEFSRIGQTLMQSIEMFPAPVYAAISGYCMGGGLDLALACRHRFAAPKAVFGHRGAALGLITGWVGPNACRDWLGKGWRLNCSLRQKKSAHVEPWRPA
jgi:enoyl-CoA hydratase